MTQSELENEVITKAAAIIRLRENEDKEAALKLWQELDQLTTEKRRTFSEEVFDLVTQLEFFMEEEFSQFDYRNLLEALNQARTKK